MIKFLLIFLTLIYSVFSESNVTKIDLNTNKTLMFTKGSQLELACPLVDVKNTSYFVTWFKNKNKLSSIITTARLKISFDKLTITSLIKIDSGIYHCEIVTGTGLILKSGIVNLEIQGVEQQAENLNSQVQKEQEGIKPEFMNYYENKTEIFYQGSKVEFDCLSTGSPQPQVLWYKNNQVVSEEEYGIVRNLMLFKFKKLLLSDSGEYRCQVFNQHGEINRYFKIQVVTIEKLMVKSNETISIKCDSSDSSDWFVKFKNLDYHSERKIQINSEEFYWIKYNSFSNLIQMDSSVDLVLSQANVLNNGLYFCVSNGQVQSKVYDIDVIDFKIENVKVQSQQQSLSNETPIPVIVIAVLSIFSICMIVILSMYYVFKLKRSSQSKSNKDIEKQQSEVNQASISYNVPVDYFRTRRYSYVPVMPTSTPSNVYHTHHFRSQMPRPNQQLYQSIIQQQDLALAHPVYTSNNSTRINSSMPTRSNSYRSFTRL